MHPSFQPSPSLRILGLSALKPEGHGDETAEQTAQEILTDQPAHSEENCPWNRHNRGSAEKYIALVQLAWYTEMLSSEIRRYTLLFAIPISLLFFIQYFPSIQLLQSAQAEDVIFVIPGSSHPASVVDFDPPLQIIEQGQSIVFVNPDGVDHHLVVKDAANKEVFDTGVIKQNQFVSHTFSENGEYALECKLYPHMKGQITVTDDIATFTQSIPAQNLDVQLTRSPASPGVEVDTYFKVIFIDKETGRNHAHIDYALSFDDSDGNYMDGMGGHTVDGAEYGSFAFDKEDAFTPKVTVTGVDFLPINPETVQFDTVVTPEFPAAIVGVMMAVAIGSIILYARKIRRLI